MIKGNYKLRVAIIYSAAICAVLALLVAFRGVTLDTLNYLAIFNELAAFPWSRLEFQNQYSMDWGYGLIAGFFKSIGMGHEILFFAISIITFFAIACAARGFGLGLMSVMPFYLPTFFLAQQLMQIRQGLAVALAFWAISVLYKYPTSAFKYPTSVFKFFTLGFFATLFHLVAVVPIIVASAIKIVFPKPKSKSRISIRWPALYFTITFLLCIGFMSTEIALFSERISIYISDAQHGYVRSSFEPANLRSVMLTAVFIVFRPKSNEIMYHGYSFLLLIYCVQLGVRMGLQDIAILSGRIGSALGFSEIFLLSMLLKLRIRNQMTRFMLNFSYLAVHFYFAFIITFPYLWNDYFTGIH